MSDIDGARNIQKRGKAPGPDGINMEAFIFGGSKQNMYLSIMFNLFVLYGSVPDAVHQATLVPLVKCKSGDLSDVNNYRAIALSNTITQMIESLLFALIESYMKHLMSTSLGLSLTILLLHARMSSRKLLIISL